MTSRPGSRVLSQQRAVAVGIGLLIVVLTYDVSGFGQASRSWAACGVLIVAALLVDAFGTARELLPMPGAAALMPVMALGVAVLCVPETDQMIVAALLPLAIVVFEVFRRHQLGLEWYAVAAASVGWAAVFGATGRQSALMGALFAWWPILLLWFVDIVRPVPSRSRAIGIAAAGTFAAAVMARTGGISDSWTVLAISTLGSAAVSLIAAFGIASVPSRSESTSLD